MKKNKVPVSVPKGEYMNLAEYVRRNKLNYANTRNRLIAGKIKSRHIHAGRMWLIKA